MIEKSFKPQAYFHFILELFRIDVEDQKATPCFQSNASSSIKF